MTARKLILKRAALATLTALAGLTAVELVARATYGPGLLSLVDPYEHHPYRPFARYQDTQAGIEIVTNSLGWKDSAPRAVARRFDGFRVVVLGDSFAEGLGLPAAQTVPARLEAALRRQGGRPVEVLNGGRVSYSPLVEYQRLRRFFAAGYHTDAVVVLPDLSDPQDDLYYEKQYELAADGSPIVLRAAAYSPPIRWTYNHLALARHLRRWQLQWTGEAIAPGETAHGGREIVLSAPERSLLHATEPLTLARYEAAPANVRALVRVAWVDHPPSLSGWAADGVRRVEANLERIVRLAAAHHAAVWVVLYPDPQSLYVDARWRDRLLLRFPRWFHEREEVVGAQPGNGGLAWRQPLLAWGRDRKVPTLDLWPLFLAQPDWPLLFRAGDVHWSAAGCDLVARRLADDLAGGLATPAN